LIAACILIIVASCNMPSLSGDRDFASQSEPLSSGGSSGGGLTGVTRLEYDHNFSFLYPGGETVQVDVTVTGEIPLTTTQGGLGPAIECVLGDTPYFVDTGSGKVDFVGTAQFSSGDDSHCSCTLADSVDVNIVGKTFFEWQNPGDKCPQPRIALQLKEQWFTDHNWQCSCTDEDDTRTMQVEQSMAMFPITGNPELEEQTLVFPYLCPAESTLEANLTDPSGLGTGSYRWTFSSGINEGPDRYKLGPSYEGWEPGMDEEPTHCAPGEWGPSLDSINQPVTEWLE